MEHRPLGRTGVTVSPLAFGTMMLGAWGNRDRASCIRMVHTALDAGVNLFDSADVYADGESEEILGEAIRGRRDDVIVATKVHGPMGDAPNRRGNSRRWITQACDASLRRLGTDWIDVYQLHRPDPSCDIEETLSALSDLVHAGKVRMIGTSTFQAEEIVEGLWAAERNHFVRFRTEQPPYNVFTRGAEVAVLPTCRRHGIGVITWTPLCGGWLTGRYRRDAPVTASPRTEYHPEKFDPSLTPVQRKYELVEQLERIAADAGLSLTHLALGFVVAHPAVSAALMGPRTEEQLADQLAALDVRLDEATLQRIDELVPPGTTIDPGDAGYVAAGQQHQWHERTVTRG